MAIAFVQSNQAASSSATSLNCSFLSNVASGSELVTGARVGATGRTITVSDGLNAGNYSQAVTQQQATDGHQAYVHYHENSGAGACTVTFAISGAAASIRYTVHEYSGVATSSSLDQTNSAEYASVTSSGNANSGTVTTGQTELIFGLVTTNNNGPGSGTPSAWTKTDANWNARETITAADACVFTDDRLDAVAGTYQNGPQPNATAANGTSLVATFKAAGAATVAAAVPLLSPIVTLATPGRPPVAQMQATGVGQNALGYVTPLEISRFVNPLSLVMGPVIFPVPSPYVIPSNQTFVQALTATATATATIIKQVNTTLSATASSTASIVKSVGKILSANASATATIVKQVNKTLTANATATATLTAIKVILVTLTATATATATMSRQVGKAVMATATSTATISRQIAKTVTAAASATASITKSITHSLSAAASATATLAAVKIPFVPPPATQPNDDFVSIYVTL